MTTCVLLTALGHFLVDGAFALGTLSTEIQSACMLHTLSSRLTRCALHVHACMYVYFTHCLGPLPCWLCFCSRYLEYWNPIRLHVAQADWQDVHCMCMHVTCMCASLTVLGHFLVGCAFARGTLSTGIQSTCMLIMHSVMTECIAIMCPMCIAWHCAFCKHVSCMYIYSQILSGDLVSGWTVTATGWREQSRINKIIMQIRQKAACMSCMHVIWMNTTYELL